MKDIRGIHVAAVKNAIFSEFKLEVIKNRSKTTVSEWKKTKKVKECYMRLYDNEDNVTNNITKRAFPNITEKDGSYYDVYVYTAAVANIVLNPDYPDIECAKKPLEHRFQKFKVFVILVFLLLI